MQHQPTNYDHLQQASESLGIKRTPPERLSLCNQSSEELHHVSNFTVRKEAIGCCRSR